MTDQDVNTVLEEIAPESERGGYKTGGFRNMTGLRDHADYSGVFEEYKKLVITKTGSTNEYRYVDVFYHGATHPHGAKRHMNKTQDAIPGSCAANLSREGVMVKGTNRYSRGLFHRLPRPAFLRAHWHDQGSLDLRPNHSIRRSAETPAACASRHRRSDCNELAAEQLRTCWRKREPVPRLLAPCS